MERQIDKRDLEIGALLEITQAINNNLSEQDLYKIYRFTLLADLEVKKLALYVKDQDWECKVHYGTEQDWSEVQLPKEYRELVDAESPQRKKPFDEFQLVFPISHKTRLLAVIFIGGLDEDDFEKTTFLRTLTNILIVAIENKKLARRQLEQEAYRKELEIAKKVQNFLFPKSLPDSNRLKIEAVYLPHQDVGGDYYDYIKLSREKFAICIADVSGKGVPAALLMSNFQASLRTLVRKTHDLEEIISELNHATYSSSDGDNFITFFLGIYDFESKEFDYVNCGHNPSIILDKNGLTFLEEGTTVLGMFDPLPFLNAGKIENLQDFLFFGYTDGLTETFNVEDEQFGVEGLQEVLQRKHWDDLSEMHQSILKALDDFRSEESYHDDITMISCLVSG